MNSNVRTPEQQARLIYALQAIEMCAMDEVMQRLQAGEIQEFTDNDVYEQAHKYIEARKAERTGG